MTKYVCSVCGYVYDEAKGIPGDGYPAGTLWSDLPAGWLCPVCGAGKSVFAAEAAEAVDEVVKVGAELVYSEDSMTDGVMSLVMGNLAKGCEKQYKQEASDLFSELASYYKAKSGVLEGRGTEDLKKAVTIDLSSYFPAAGEVAKGMSDRGAMRALVWSEKVSNVMKAVVERTEAQETTARETRSFVCEICGYIHIGGEAPEICPVCKVPSMKIVEVVRG